MAVIFIPVLGILFFLLVGAGRLPKHRRDKQRFVTETIMARTEGGLDKLSNRTQWPDWLPSIAVLNRNLGALPMIGGNTAELIDDYVGSIDAMIADIDPASDYVHVEFFILVHDDTTAPFFDALARACGRGVTVRVLSDHVAQYSYPNRKKTLKVLRRWGRSTGRCCRCSRSRATGGGPTCATTASSWWSTALIGHAGSQNMIVDHYHKKAEHRSEACTGTS